MTFCWLTDVHLNFLEPYDRKAFYHSISATHCDAVFITGDIAEAPSISPILTEMADTIEKPIYFVLGNHDFYSGSVAEVKRRINQLSSTHDHLNWVAQSTVFPISEQITLVGCDGWADGRYGDYLASPVRLNDSRLIAELKLVAFQGQQPLLSAMQTFADADAAELKQAIEKAVLTSARRIIVLTHVPPFPEVCMHEGQQSDNNWLPFFSSKATGDVLLSAAERYPDKNFLVLCGHTHSAGDYSPRENIRIRAGKAQYRFPEIQDVFS